MAHLRGLILALSVGSALADVVDSAAQTVTDAGSAAQTLVDDSKSGSAAQTVADTASAAQTVADDVKSLAQTVAASAPCYAHASKEQCCQSKDGRSDPKFKGQQCAAVLEGKKFHSGWTCEPTCFVDGTLCKDPNNAQDVGEGEDESAIIDKCVAPTTTTPTVSTSPLDSSASSGSNSLKSWCSSSLRTPWASSTSSTDSSVQSSGSEESGSWGCYPSLPLWPFLCCPIITLCLAPLLGVMKPKPKPKPKKKEEQKPEPLPSLATPELVLPSMALPVPSYSIVAPLTTSVQPLMQPPIMTTAAPMYSMAPPVYETVAPPVIETVAAPVYETVATPYSMPMQSAPLLGTTAMPVYTGGTMALPAYSAPGYYQQ